jgi:tripartite-type tricarboxylate transporter receptor subunit TctC
MADLGAGRRGRYQCVELDGVACPERTPRPIIDKLSAKVAEILNMPDLKTRFAAGGVSTIPSTPAELDAKIKREAASYRLVIQKANVHVD